MFFFLNSVSYSSILPADPLLSILLSHLFSLSVSLFVCTTHNLCFRGGSPSSSCLSAPGLITSPVGDCVISCFLLKLEEVVHFGLLAKS